MKLLHRNAVWDMLHMLKQPIICKLKSIIYQQETNLEEDIKNVLNKKSINEIENIMQITQDLIKNPGNKQQFDQLKQALELQDGHFIDTRYKIPCTEQTELKSMIEMPTTVADIDAKNLAVLVRDSIEILSEKEPEKNYQKLWDFSPKPNLQKKSGTNDLDGKTAKNKNGNAVLLTKMTSCVDCNTAQDENACLTLLTNNKLVMDIIGTQNTDAAIRVDKLSAEDANKFARCISIALDTLLTGHNNIDEFTDAIHNLPESLKTCILNNNNDTPVLKTDDTEKRELLKLLCNDLGNKDFLKEKGIDQHAAKTLKMLMEKELNALNASLDNKGAIQILLANFILYITIFILTFTCNDARDKMNTMVGQFTNELHAVGQKLNQIISDSNNSQSG